MDFTEVLEKFGIEPPAHLRLIVTYHDPCHLARGQEITEQPRVFVRQVADIVRDACDMLRIGRRGKVGNSRRGGGPWRDEEGRR